MKISIHFILFFISNLFFILLIVFLYQWFYFPCQWLTSSIMSRHLWHTAHKPSRKEPPHAQGHRRRPKAPGCDGAGAAERTYSTFKVSRGDLVQGKEQRLHFARGAKKRYPMSKVRQTHIRWYVLREGIRRQTHWNHNHRKLTNLITWTTALSNSMKLSHAMWGHPRRTGHGGEVWQNVAHWRREWKTTSIFLPWEPQEQYEKAKW